MGIGFVGHLRDVESSEQLSSVVPGAVSTDTPTIVESPLDLRHTTADRVWVKREVWTLADGTAKAARSTMTYSPDWYPMSCHLLVPEVTTFAFHHHFLSKDA